MAFAGWLRELRLLVLGVMVVCVPAAEGRVAVSSEFSSRQLLAMDAQVRYLQQEFPPLQPGRLGLCTFNIQWVGHFRRKKHQELAQLVRNCHVIAVQELVGPPWDMPINPESAAGPDPSLSTTHPGDPQAAEFHAAMVEAGFDGVLIAPIDTGPARNLSNNAESEWPVLYYKTSHYQAAPDLPQGYIHPQLTLNPVFSRVPYAFALRSHRGHDLVILSVHLRPLDQDDPRELSMAKRIAEFQTIAAWIAQQKRRHPSGEQDFFIMGDMNVEGHTEYRGFLGSIDPSLAPFVSSVYRNYQDHLDHEQPQRLSFRSLNFNASHHDSILYSTNLRLSKPYDHIMFEVHDLTIDFEVGLEIIDLAGTLDLDGYESTRRFIEHYSDHNPLRMVVMDGPDEDG